MNVCHFEYEHDMKLVGELLVSAPFMGLSICLPLSVFPYFHLFMELYQSMGLSICFSLCISLYMGLSMSFLSLYFLIFIPSIELYQRCNGNYCSLQTL